MIDMKMATCQYGVVWSSVPIQASPTTSMNEPTTISGFHRPVRVTSCPPMVEVSIWVTISGMVISPARVGVWPPASWKYWVRKVLLPNIATPTPTLARIISSRGAVAQHPDRHHRLGHPQLDDDREGDGDGERRPGTAADCQEIQA